MISSFKLIFSFFLVLWALLGVSSIAYAADDPRLKPINKVGINLLSPESEIDDAFQMINNNGDWGWVLIIIKKSERNVDRWQGVFHQLTKKRLIPIVRIATDFDSAGYWQRPTEEDAHAWADFLSKLYWPTKNRYVQIYNEVNHANEWGGTVDAPGYAKEFIKTAAELKSKSDEFFILNAPLDLAVATSTSSLDAGVFYQTMADTIPDVFKKLDGWASHSYPNPGFTSSPFMDGKNSLKGYQWELNFISKYVERDLPVFITETGWRRQTENQFGLPEQTVADYYKQAFENVWTDERVVAITPFVFHYQDGLFNAFSFKDSEGKLKEKFYSYYFTIRDLIKGKGNPERKNIADKIDASIPSLLITNLKERVKVKIKNTGNEIWELGNNTNLEVIPDNLEITDFNYEKGQILPGEDLLATFKVRSQKSGDVNLELKTVSGGNVLATTTVKTKSESVLMRLFEILKAGF